MHASYASIDSGSLGIGRHGMVNNTPEALTIMIQSRFDDDLSDEVLGSVLVHGFFARFFNSANARPANWPSLVAVESSSRRGRYDQLRMR